MPPKFKFTKQQIIDAAIHITRQGGISTLTARALAAELGSSVKPIFGLLPSMDDVQNAVLSSAYTRYQAYIQSALSSDKRPPYKASGIAYIRFAKEEKELFKLLFMRDRSGETIVENRDELRPILNILMKELSLSELFALLGVNGAGKTTTIKMLTYLTKPDSGNALVGSHSILTESSAVKRMIGVSPQETAVAPILSVKENLELMCGV